MVTPTPASAFTSSASSTLATHTSKKMARHAERLHATFSLRQQAAIDAANREREAWLAWRREVKARREAKEASAVQDALVPGAKAKAGDNRSKAGKAGKKDAKSRKLKAEEKGATKAKKDRKRGHEREVNIKPVKADKAAPKVERQVMAPTAVPAETEVLASALAPAKESAGRPAGPPPATPSPAPVASTSTTTQPPALTSAPPLPPSTPARQTTPSSLTPPSTTSLLPDLSPSHEVEDDWSDYYSDDDQDPAWLSDSEPELDDDDFEDLLLDQDEGDSWFFSVPTLAKMASNIRTSLRQERKQTEVEGPGGWGIRLVGGGGLMLV